MIEPELQKALSRAVETPAGACLEYRYPASFSGFAGHFPGEPILPGVCLFQSVRVGLETLWGRPLHLAEISNAKFIAPVRPDEAITFALTLNAGSSRTAQSVALKVKVLRRKAAPPDTENADERIAEFWLQLH